MSTARRVSRVCAATLAAMLLALPALPPAKAADAPEAKKPEPAPSRETVREDEQALERAEAERLRRLREEQEARRTEAARKRDAEQARQNEIRALQSTLTSLEQRESTLNHDVRSVQQQLYSLPRDPADQSAMARRSELERRLSTLESDLRHATRSRESAAQRLDSLRFR